MRQRLLGVVLLLGCLGCGGGDPGADRSQAAAPATSAPAPAAPAPYAVNVVGARKALRTLTAATLARRQRSQRLFVEGYYLRSIVAAHEALVPADSLDTQAGIRLAVAFADGLVRRQDDDGYWYIGYDAAWLADIAATLGLFRVLEAHVDSGQARRYEEAAARFIAAARRDSFILASGAVGVGRPKAKSTDKTWHPEIGDVRQPYIVSTALVGVALQAWLHQRTGDPAYKQGALAALDWSLAQIAADDTLSSPARGESALFVAAYVEEGWMAADMLLDDPEVRAHLRQRLPPHVDWLLRTQGKDGTWSDGALPSFVRTPAIVDFLIWYDQRWEGRDDVRAAIRSASVFLANPLLWEHRLAQAHLGDVEVFHALVGRPLVALVTAKPVL